MLSKQHYIHHSLHLNLFFLRIIKEHFIFLEAALFMKNKILMREANLFKEQFEQLLKHTVMMAQCLMPAMGLDTDEFVTKYTLDAEKITEYATGIPIDRHITQLELSSLSDKPSKHTSVPAEEQVYRLNERIIKAVSAVITVKTNLLEDVLSCKLFVNTYPSLLEHVTEEAAHYLEHLTRLQKGMEIDTKADLLKHENFWNHIMAEHSYFIRGLLDPEEKDLFNIADTFAKEFDRLTEETASFDEFSADLSMLTAHTLKAVTAIREFKSQATEGLLNCQIKAIILPLLADHVLREANHYRHSLRMEKD